MANWIEVQDSNVSSSIFVDLDQICRLEIRNESVRGEMMSRAYVWADGMHWDEPGIRLNLDESSSWNNQADAKKLLDRLGTAQ